MGGVDEMRSENKGDWFVFSVGGDRCKTIVGGELLDRKL